ncbi:MAG: hypothetical protein HRT35_30710, partial [Algicola sp.]|nr:hypothetical protein [Algicola sp.]
EDLRSLNYATVTISEVNVVPLAVSQLTVNQGHKTFDISWVPLSGFEDSYELEQNSGPNRYNDDNWAVISKPPETTSHALTNVANDSYFFRVRACRDGGLMCGPWVTSDQYTMDAPSTEPPPVALGSHETADVDSDIIGSIKGSAGISGGAASYSVPIQLPPGRAGMAPGVSLNYSSNGGNGLVGQGWSLSAGGSVSRCAATYAIDKRHDAVQYNANDKLCLNGQRLILQSGSYGGNTSTYHPEMRPTTTVTLSGSWSDGGSAFTVMLGNGKTQYYGSNGNSILTRTAFPVPHTWLLTQTKDQHDNTIDYTYNEAAHLQAPDASSSYLTTIHYTGRGTNKGDRKVHFSYTERDDVTMGYRAGSMTVRNQRLSTITTWADDTTPAQRYNLTYQSGARMSILQSIEQCFSAGTENCLPMTTFGVKGLNTVNPDDASTPISIFKATSTVARTFISTDNSAYESDFSMSADYDGDGKNDLLINESNLTNVNVKLSGNPTEQAITGLHARNKTYDYATARIINQQMDFNLDGITDFIGFTDPTQRGYDNGVIDGKVGFAYYDGAEMVTATGSIDYFCSTNGYYKTTDTTQGGVVTTLTYRDCSTYVIDVNKDGKMDLMVSEQTAADTNNWVVYLNTYEPSFDANGNDINKGTISFDKVSGSFTTTGTDGFDAPMQIMDINGDGYDDLVGQYEYQPTSSAAGANWTWAAFTPTYSPNAGISNDSIVFTEMSTYKVNRHAGVVAEQMVDINQDGLVDYLYSDYDVRLELFRNNTYHIRLNNGKDFDAPVAWSQQLTGGVYYDQDDNPLDLSPYVKVLDYNRDGVMDLIVPGTRAAKAWCASTGTYCHAVDPTYDLYHWTVWLGQHGTIDFVEQAHQLNIIAPLIDLSFSDFNGDGYVDAVTRLGRLASPAYYQMQGGNTPGIHVYYNQNAETDLMKTITDGMDMVTEFDYDVLSMTPVGNDPPLYNVDFKRSQFPYNNFATTDTVVSEMRTSTGLVADPFNTTKFYYSEARFHKQGRGFQGFGVIEEVNVRADITTKTEYAQNFPYSGMVEQQWTYLTGQNNITHFLSWSQNSDFTDARDENSVVEAGEHPLYLPYAKSSTSISKEIGIMIGSERAIGVTKSSSLSNKTLDGNGNLTRSTSLVCDGVLGSTKDCDGSPWKKQTTTTDGGYTLHGGAYKPSSSSTESTVTYNDALGGTNPTLKVTKGFTYETNGNVLTVTTTDTTTGSTAQSLTQIFDYYGAGSAAAGQVKRITIPSSSTPVGQNIQGERWVQTAYTPDGYFVAATHNSQWGEGDSNKASSQTVLATTGQVDTQTDVNGNISTTIFDGYNRAIRVISSHTTGTALSVPDVTSGIQSCAGSKVNGACTNTFGLAEVYRTVTQQAGSPTAYTYLDKAGRVLRQTTTGFNDELIKSSTKYDTEGRVLEQESDAGTVTFTGFDALNRPLGKTVRFDPQKYDVAFAYKGLTTEMDITPRGTHGNTTPRHISRTTNSAGKLMTSVD